MSRAMVLSFSMIVGISIASYQATLSRGNKNINLNTGVNINNKMIELFGYGGISVGGDFLKKLIVGNEV